MGNISDLTERIARINRIVFSSGKKHILLRGPAREVLHRLFKLKSTFNLNEHKINITLAGQYNHRSEFDIVRNQDIKGPQISPGF